MRSDREPEATVADDAVPDRAAMAAAVADFLRAAGLPGAARSETPQRTAGAWADELLRGYRVDPLDVLDATWPDRTGELVSLERVPFVSVCTHHLLPFFGQAHLAYMPAGKLTGLSRLESLVDCLARRLQVQERLTEEIVDALMDGLDARGAICVLEAEHLCVTARGKRRHEIRTRTIASRGEFVEDPSLQDRFLNLIGASRDAVAAPPTPPDSMEPR